MRYALGMLWSFSSLCDAFSTLEKVSQSVGSWGCKTSLLRPCSHITKVAIWAAVGVPVFGNQSGGIVDARAIVVPTWATNWSPSPTWAPSSAVSIAVSMCHAANQTS
eukprot:COSAG06_NODE_10938_length_1593_cov_42.445783_2_plen_107_part_00